MIGTTIGHYKIESKLGEGGMGVVYKAHDTTLNRDVALKFLPAHVSGSEQDKNRFLQEAQAAASLSHPNICTIHGIEEHEGKQFIVMEFVEGKTMQEKKGDLPLKKALEIGIQIADGLAAAHEKGIVHRDIKPDNIMVRKDGTVQIMDFGLAKLRGATRLTKEGSTVGTAGYMSPEQIQGLEVDHRTDIFSLGVLLYEMIAGQSPFKGVHETAIAYEVVNVDPPPIAAVKPGLDPELSQIVADCMAKDPAERYQSAAEVSRNLKRAKKDSGSKTRSAVMDSSSPQRSKERGLFTPERIAWLAVTVVLIGAFLAVLLTQQNAEPSPTIRFTVVPPENSTINQVSLSPNGEYLAFTATGAGRTLLWVRPLNDISSHSLAGTDGAAFPFWSPDGQFIGFFSGGRLKKVGVSGGTPITICDAPDGRGGTWNKDGVILFSPTPSGVIYSVAAGGGVPKAVTSLDTTRREHHHVWPAFLPDGQQFLYSGRQYDHDRSLIHFASLSSGDTRSILTADGNVSVVSPGYLVFLNGGTLMAQDFDFSTGNLSGDPHPIAENVANVPLFGLASFSVSANGVLAIGGGRSTSRQYSWFDRKGRLIGTAGKPGNYFDINVSPDGKFAATQFTDLSGQNSDIWLIDLTTGAASRFTFNEAVEDDPIWSPDGKTVVYLSIRDGVLQVFQKPANGRGAEQRLPFDGRPASWSRDGRIILYNEGDRTSQDNVMAFPMTGEGKPIPYLYSAAGEVYPQFSPDGNWVAYVSNETGRYEVYVQSFPASGGKWQISSNGGSQPRWRSDGRELFFISADKVMMATEVQTSGTFRSGIPKPLFETQVDNFDAPNRYVVGDSGQRFLINVPADESAASPVGVVVNWPGELKKK